MVHVSGSMPMYTWSGVWRGSSSQSRILWGSPVCCMMYGTLVAPVNPTLLQHTYHSYKATSTISYASLCVCVFVCTSLSPNMSHDTMCVLSVQGLWPSVVPRHRPVPSRLHTEHRVANCQKTQHEIVLLLGLWQKWVLVWLLLYFCVEPFKSFGPTQSSLQKLIVTN